MISVLVVDDSIFIRKRISKILEADRRISVVGTAVNGADVPEKIEKLKPDVITLDVEMPVMNGLEALETIVREYSSIPVVMLSALTREGAEVTLRALEMGAVDFITKPSATDENEVRKFSRDLTLKIRAANLARKNQAMKRTAKKVKIKQQTVEFKRNRFMDPTKLAVALGISTGGPKTLLEVIPLLPDNFPGSIFIAQHMPPGFTKSLAERLDGLSRIRVKEARNGEVVAPSVCYVAPGGHHMTVMHMSLSKGVMIRIVDEPKNALYKPSVDVLMTSVAKIYGSNTIGIVMTGMGRDGTRGMKEIKGKGGLTITEHRSSCVVYGMPKSVEESGLSDYVAPANHIPRTLVSILSKYRY